MGNLLEFASTFFKAFFGITKAPPPVEEETSVLESIYKEEEFFVNAITAAIKLRIVRFMINVPLVTVDGGINPAWEQELALGYPTLVEEEIKEFLLALKGVQDEAVELFLSGREEELEATSMFDTAIAKIDPKVSRGFGSFEYRIMRHGKWISYVPGM